MAIDFVLYRGIEVFCPLACGDYIIRMAAL